MGALLADDVHGRVFTDTQGRKIQAEIVNLDGDRLMIKLQKTGKTAEVKMEILSKADREYVMQWMRDKKALAAQQRAHRHEHSQSGVNNHTSHLMTQYDLKENYDAKWPRLVSTDIGIDITVMSEDENKREFVYHSPNYEFVCDVKLTKNVVKKFAVMFEATREYCRLLPISTMKAHVPGGEFRHKILLFEDKETYMQKGGMPGSAGVFVSRGGNGVVMVPLTSLGVIKGKAGYRYDYDKSNKTLTHEIAHQLTDIEYISSPGSRGWFSEGLAEYVAVTPYRSGKFMAGSILDEIRDYVTAYGEKGRGGRALGEKFEAPDLEKYMLQSYESFTQDANFNYGLGLLMTYYIFHMEDDRTNAVAFLKALKKGKRGQEAVDALLNGRSYEQLEEQIAKAWKPRGVKISFR
ncbi:MAG: hypothetical protein P8P36_07240 [Akkermansiaceae bacterium]|nr:hypothetical protein [Akkermansiaceae bacterium]